MTKQKEKIKIQIPKPDFKPHEWQLKILKTFDEGLKRFFLLCWHRRARKTTLLLNLLIRECARFASSVYAYISPTYRQAKAIVWRDPNMMDKYLPQEIVARKNETELFIEFKNKSILHIKGADEPDSLRGIDFSGVALDEFALIKPQVWEEILRPVIAQNPQRWAMFAFTPKGRNHAYKYFISAKEKQDWFADVLPASISKLFSTEELEKMKKELPERIYRQELECEFLENVASVFKGVENCISGKLEEPQKGLSYVMGVDLAKSEDFSVIAVICRDSKHLVHFERFKDISWNAQKERIILTAQRYNNAHIIIDSTGLGDPIEEDLRRARLSVEGFKFTNISKQDLIERLMLAIEQRLITFPYIEELINELQSFECKISETSQKIIYSAPEGMYDDCVIALALAVWGLKTFLYTKPFEIIRENLPTETEHEYIVLDY